MALCYKKLWKLLIDKDMTRASLREAAGIAPATIAKMSRGEDFSKCEQRACSEIRAYKNSGQCQLGGAHRKKIYLPFRNLRGYYDWYYETEEECLKRSAKASTMKDWKCIHNIDTYINDAYNNCADKKDPFDVHEGSR